MTLNVWLINHYSLAPNQAGITRHHTLARLMQDQDIDTTLIASSVDYISRQDTRLAADESSKMTVEEGVRFLWLRTPLYTGNNAGRGRNILAFAQAVLGLKPSKDLPRPDLIIGSSPQPFAAGAALVLARRFKVPFVLEIRDIWPNSLIDLGNMSPRHPFIMVLSVLEKILYKQADLIISPLQGAKDHIQQVAGKSVSFVWIPNGVELQSRVVVPETKTSTTFDVIYAGAHGAANKLDTMLDAAALLQKSADPLAGSVRFVLVGDGPEKARLQILAGEQGLGNIVFRDPVPKKEVPEILAAADVCLMPLKNSPVFFHGVSPNKLFDYFAAARPVIFAVNTAFSAVKQADAGLSIPPEDPQALADAVLQLAALPSSERQAMGERGRAYAAEHYDMRGLARRLANVLHMVAGRTA